MSDSPLNELLTIEELEANTRALSAEHGKRVTVSKVGESWAGRPIEMISFGEGAQQVLAVGVPHANEPAGAVTVERMIRLMLGPDGERERRGMRWNFIKAIDPEGLRLNGGWLKAGRTVRNYVENFFRPPPLRQPETTFPFRIGDYEFRDSTPENRAYQRAFELTRPIVHACLHHCDIGGAFHCLSRNMTGLAASLDRIILDHGIVHMSGFEAPGLPLRWMSSSVAIYPAVDDIVVPAIATGKSVAAAWPFGEMSPGYGEKSCCTLTIITEVPLWDDARLRDDSASGVTESGRLARQAKEFADLRDFLERTVPKIRAFITKPDEEQIFAALAESVNDVTMINALFEGLKATVDPTKKLTVAEYLTKTLPLDMAAARILGTARRLAAMLTKGSDCELRSVVAEAAAALDRITRDVMQSDRFEPTPISAMTGVQMNSILAAVDAVRQSA